jgi:DNA-binding NarL/FixJ family response regulator
MRCPEQVIAEQSAAIEELRADLATLAAEVRELRVLATGSTNQAIARELVVTVDPAKRHVGHILAKLGVANRTEAVTRAC